MQSAIANMRLSTTPTSMRSKKQPMPAPVNRKADSAKIQQEAISKLRSPAHHSAANAAAATASSVRLGTRRSSENIGMRSLDGNTGAGFDFDRNGSEPAHSVQPQPLPADNRTKIFADPTHRRECRR